PGVTNRALAPVQITAKQLLQEAQEQQETGHSAPQQKEEYFEKLHKYSGRKQKEFEEFI
ncbi:hypothetical protein BY996DRAFT_4540228, partial [Phakopsora pachyrhizi]